MPSSSPASAVSGSPPPPHVVEDCLGIVQLFSDGTVTRSADYSRSWASCHPAYLSSGRTSSTTPCTGSASACTGPPEPRARPSSRCSSTSTAAASAPAASSFPTSTPPGSGSPPGSRRSCYPPTTAWRPSTVSPRRTATRRPCSWLRAQAAPASDPWLAESADLGRVFVCGDSAGGNISHHIAVRHGSSQLALDPVRLAGCVMLWPFFTGEERTASEAAGLDDRHSMGTALFDQMWRLALPVGATRDHPAANPFGPESVTLDEVAFPPVLVVDPDQDVLHDRIADYAARLTAMGKPVELVLFRGQGHGFFVFEPWGEASDQLIEVIRQLVHGR